MCYNYEGEPVSFLFSQDITTDPLEDARMLLYLEDLKRTDISTRPFEKCMYYYLLGERLEAQFWSLNAKKIIRIKFSDSAYRYTWNAASHVYKLYHARGIYNLLTVQNITANALLRLSNKNFEVLVEEAKSIRAVEINDILEFHAESVV
ncbi:33333_t:CDS:2 [Gigaspora margarita]|uniref:33333_t:CDS:1 n=1 Tax=Gigaspora margarita TaxID=4874 RepID=A0ABN7VAI8_GIGMA|nr:33333_t:CDS:2 [Gigaspora margarita]